MAVSLGGGHLLGSRWGVCLVSHALEALALELGELDAVGGVGDVEVEDRPDQGEADWETRPTARLTSPSDEEQPSLRQRGCVEAEARPSSPGRAGSAGRGAVRRVQIRHGQPSRADALADVRAYGRARTPREPRTWRCASRSRGRSSTEADEKAHPEDDEQRDEPPSGMS